MLRSRSFFFPPRGGERSAESVGLIGVGSHPILMMGWCCSNFETCLMKLIFTWLVVTGTMEFYDFPETVGNNI